MKRVDKIRVLLIDDEAPGLLRVVEHEGREYWLPKLGPTASATSQIEGIEKLFEVRWLPTAEEAREFRDLSKTLSLLDPAALGSEGWVPEVLCFDYALTVDINSVTQRLPAELAAAVSPLGTLRRCAADRRVSVPPPAPPPQTDTASTWDNEGCYCGGLILTLFWAHPCAPIALTTKGPNKTLGTEAAFFEWMLELDGGGTFENKERPTLDWHELLLEAVPNLRRRIEQLLQGRAIEAGLDDLLALAESGEHDALEIRSRYAVRRLPVAGLFADVPAAELRTEVRAWARRCLAILFGDLLAGEREDAKPADLAHRLDPALGDFRAGVDHAARLWQAYHSDQVWQRYRLSELGVRSLERPLEAYERSELERLCEMFGVDPNHLDARKCTKNCHELRSVEGGRIRRWAALMVMVQLEMHAAAARGAWRQLCRELHYQEQFDPLIQAVLQEDVYLALFPIPAGPIITPVEAGKPPSEAWSHPLKDLSSGEERHDLALNIKEVLAGKKWQRNGAEGGCSPCGLHAGERYLLRLYARTLEPFAEEWLAGVSWLAEPLQDRGAEGAADGQ